MTTVATKKRATAKSAAGASDDARAINMDDRFELTESFIAAARDGSIEAPEGPALNGRTLRGDHAKVALATLASAGIVEFTREKLMELRIAVAPTDARDLSPAGSVRWLVRDGVLAPLQACYEARFVPEGDPDRWLQLEDAAGALETPEFLLCVPFGGLRPSPRPYVGNPQDMQAALTRWLVAHYQLDELIGMERLQTPLEGRAALVDAIRVLLDGADEAQLVRALQASTNDGIRQSAIRRIGAVADKPARDTVAAVMRVAAVPGPVQSDAAAIVGGWIHRALSK